MRLTRLCMEPSTASRMILQSMQPSNAKTCTRTAGVTQRGGRLVTAVRALVPQELPH